MTDILASRTYEQAGLIFHMEAREPVTLPNVTGKFILSARVEDPKLGRVTAIYKEQTGLISVPGWPSAGAIDKTDESIALPDKLCSEFCRDFVTLVERNERILAAFLAEDQSDVTLYRMKVNDGIARFEQNSTVPRSKIQ